MKTDNERAAGIRAIFRAWNPEHGAESLFDKLRNIFPEASDMEIAQAINEELNAASRAVLDGMLTHSDTLH